MSTVLILIGLGLLLIAAEVIIPGGVLGLAGALMIAAGAIYSFTVLGSFQGSLVLAGALFAAGVIIYLQFKFLPKTRFGRRFFLNSAIDESSNSLPANKQELIGKVAKSVTILSPTGYIEIDGSRYEAVSISGQVPEGAELTVTGSNSFQLKVQINR